MVNTNELKNLTENALKEFRLLQVKMWNEGQSSLRKYSQNDARCNFFVGASQTFLWALIHLDTFNEMLDSNDKKISKYINLNPKSKLVCQIQHDTLNRISLITKLMFDVEMFIKNLMCGCECPPKGKYYDFTRDFLKFLGITDIQKHKILNAPYQICNSLHNNGYVYHDFQIELRGKNYEFIKGQQLKHASWSDQYVFIDELTDVLSEIVKNPTVSSCGLIPHTDELEKKY